MNIRKGKKTRTHKAIINPLPWQFLDLLCWIRVKLVKGKWVKNTESASGLQLLIACYIFNHHQWDNFIFTLSEFLSYGLGNPPSCGEDCKFLWDGFGRWSNGTWRSDVKGIHITDEDSRAQNVLHISEIQRPNESRSPEREKAWLNDWVRNLFIWTSKSVLGIGVCLYSLFSYCKLQTSKRLFDSHHLWSFKDKFNLGID